MAFKMKGFPMHNTSALKNVGKGYYKKENPSAAFQQEEGKHPLYEQLSEEEKIKYDGLDEVAKSNIDKNTNIGAFTQALAEHGVEEEEVTREEMIQKGVPEDPMHPDKG